MAGFVVIGAGLAGASAAIALRKYSIDARVTLIGEEDEVPYERPPLSKGYLRGEQPVEKLFVRPRAFYEEQTIDTMFGSRASALVSNRCWTWWRVAEFASITVSSSISIVRPASAPF